MPTTRAGLLAEVIETSVRRWEMRRPVTVIVPDTDPHLTADVLLDCYADIAHLAVTGTALWNDAVAAVGTRLKQHWGRSPGAADTAARHIIEYWDATAGVFITHTPQGALVPRTRLCAEIGDARWALRTPHAVSAWMGDVMQDRERWETARLAAGLSSAAAHALITGATAVGGSLLDLVHDTLTDGVAFDDDSLHAYRQAQLNRLVTLPEHYPDPGPGVLNLDHGRSQHLSPLPSVGIWMMLPHSSTLSVSRAPQPGSPG